MAGMADVSSLICAQASTTEVSLSVGLKKAGPEHFYALFLAQLWNMSIS